MGLFERFKKPAPEETPAVEPDTLCLLLMGRVLEDIGPAAERLAAVFGPGAVGQVDRSHPRAPAFTVTLDGLEFWVSYLPMPLPKEELDVAYAAQYNLFLTPEERQAFVGNKSFFVLAQKGGGASLAEKRRTCWVFSLLCAALLEMDGAVGVSVNNKGLLVSKRTYLNYRGQMEGRSWDNADGYFPVPLWVWLYGGTRQGKPTFQTWGLKDFGFPELAFLDPKRPAQEIVNLLFTLSSRQLTGRDRYQNGALVPLDEKTEARCQADGDTLLLLGA